MEVDRHLYLPPDVRNLLNQLQQQHLLPNNDTIRRWRRQEEELGHFRACVRNGNGSHGPRLRGVDLILLAIFRSVYPKSTAAEVNAFLYEANYGNVNFRFYTNSQITEAEQFIGLTRKKGSTTAYQAYLEVNLRKRWVYWNLPYPLGIANHSASLIIDLDECGIFLESTDRQHGKAYSGVRVEAPGPYSKTDKWNMAMAICGENGGPGRPSRRWNRMWLDGGTTTERVVNFVHDILQDIGPARPGNFFIFTWDNLNSHKSEAVVALINAYGHGVTYRAPYYACDGAIEYFFNSLQSMLRARMHSITDGPSLRNAVNQSIQSVNDFSTYFRKVGFVVP